MTYDFIAIPDAGRSPATDPLFQHLVTTYASETNKTASMWRAIPDDLLDFKPHQKVNTIRAIWSTRSSPSDGSSPSSSAPRSRLSRNCCLLAISPPVEAYLDKYVGLAKRRLPQLAEATTDWWLREMPFFGGLKRQRIWTFWRRVLHTCHHRTQIQTWLRLSGQHVPAIYGPSGDVKWDEADPTYSLEAAKRGG